MAGLLPGLAAAVAYWDCHIPSSMPRSDAGAVPTVIKPLACTSNAKMPATEDTVTPESLALMIDAPANSHSSIPSVCRMSIQVSRASACLDTLASNSLTAK
jgi:hypothetical protein